jgi:prepilin-type N-terminal cleavage/methylation domain-containing protein
MKTSIEKKAFTLVEILIAIAIFSMVATVVISFSMESYKATEMSTERFNAQAKIDEIRKVIGQNKNAFWEEIIENTESGHKSYVLNSGNYILTDGEVESSGLTSYFTINRAYRDSGGDLDETLDATNGTEDIRTRLIEIVVQWTDEAGVTQETRSHMFITSWNNIDYLETTDQEFTQGTVDQTRVTALEDGEVQLEAVTYADWCEPQDFRKLYDLPDMAMGNTISAEPGSVAIGSSGIFRYEDEAFTMLEVDSESPPNVTILETFEGYSVRDIFLRGDYAYLSTSQDDKDIVIVDTSLTPYQEVGYIDTYGILTPRSIVVENDKAYIAHDNRLFIADVSSKSGERSIIGNERIGSFFSHISDLKVKDSIVYAALRYDWEELVIVDTTDPSDYDTIGIANVNGDQTSEIQINEDASRIYLGTGSFWDKAEFFIIDNTSPNYEKPLISTIDTNGMTITGVSVIDDRVILVGYGGEEYQVWDIEDEQNIFKCGGMQIDDGVLSIDTVKFDDKAFSYITTSVFGSEFQVIEGGLGIGGSGGQGYIEEGTFTSQVFDSGSDTSQYYYLIWEADQPENTEIRLQLRSSSAADMSGATWVGPDGTGGTYYTVDGGQYIPSALSGNRYIQYKAFMSSDMISTPTLKEVKIEYQK